MGAGTLVVEVADTAIEGEAVSFFVSERVEYIAAVNPAPVAALTAAMIASVDLDILAVLLVVGIYCRRERSVTGTDGSYE